MPTDEKTDDALDWCLSALVLLLALPAVLLMRAWVVGKLWAWHFVPTAGEVPSLPTLFGLTCLASLLMPVFHASKGGPKKATEMVLNAAVVVLVVLGLGYLAVIVR